MKYLIKKVKRLKNSKGIFAEPEKRKKIVKWWKKKLKVLGTLELDESSRMCPMKKEYMSAKINGKKI